MRRSHPFASFAFCLLTAVLFGAIGCGVPTEPARPDAGGPPAGIEVRQIVGAAGGTVSHPSGASLVVPRGALTQDVELSILNLASPSAELLGGPALGEALKLGPSGTRFLLPVELALPFDPSLVPEGAAAGNARVLISANGTSDFTQLDTQVDPERRLLVAQTLHFSTVAPALPSATITISPATLPEGVVGLPFAVTLGAVGGTPPYRFEIVGGELPSVSLDGSSGELSGTPNVGGSFVFDVRATDSSAPPLSTEKAFTLTVGSPSHPVPSVTELSPARVLLGSPEDLELAVSGDGFVSGAKILWNGETELATTYVNVNTLVGTVPSALLQTAGTFAVGVINPESGGGSSGTVVFSVENPLPELFEVTPSSIPVGVVPVQVTLSGRNFVKGSVAVVDEEALATTFRSATELDVTIPSSLTGSDSRLVLGVLNPEPGGGNSTETVTLTVGTGGGLGSGPPPMLQSIYPNEARAGSHDLVVSASGSNFAPDATILVDGQPVASERTSATSINFTLAAATLASPRVVEVNVLNPGPTGGKVGTSKSFTVVTSGNPVPTITAINPDTISRGGTGNTSLVLTGTGIVSNSVTRVLFDGLGIAKVINTSTQLTLTLNPAHTAVAGTFPVQLLNNGPGGGSSAPYLVTISGSNPAPTIDSLVPDVLGVGTSDYRLVVKGSEFTRLTAISASDGQTTTALGLCTTQVAGECSVTVPAWLMTSARTLTLTLTNPAPGGGSASATLGVSGDPTPQLSGVNPLRLVKGGGDQTVTFSGSGFSARSVVVEAGSGTELQTAFLSEQELSAIIPASLTTAAGNLAFMVKTPAPGGGTTPARNIAVVAVPQLTSISPSTVAAGSPTFTLTINGVDLDQPGFGLVRLGSNPLFPDTTGASWTVTVDAIHVAAPGTLDVSVYFEGNPESNRLPLTIQ